MAPLSLTHKPIHLLNVIIYIYIYIYIYIPSKHKLQKATESALGQESVADDWCGVHYGWCGVHYGCMWYTWERGWRRLGLRHVWNTSGRRESRQECARRYKRSGTCSKRNRGTAVCAVWGVGFVKDLNISLFLFFTLSLFLPYHLPSFVFPSLLSSLFPLLSSLFPLPPFFTLYSLSSLYIQCRRMHYFPLFLLLFIPFFIPFVFSVFLLPPFLRTVSLPMVSSNTVEPPSHIIQGDRIALKSGEGIQIHAIKLCTGP